MRSVVGVLAVQGGFGAHIRALEEIGLEAVEIRRAGDLEGLDGLVLPGGESTAQLHAIARLGMERTLIDLIRSGRPVLATCAGLILIAARVGKPEQASFEALDVEVERNAWGRQVDSFEAVDDSGAREMTFIRAPRITRVGPGVEVLARLRGEPVLVRQGAIVAATFHPELGADRSVHRETFTRPLRAARP